MVVLIRGGGDLASGVAYRLHRSGLKVVITERPQPLAVRRLVAFSEAVYAGKMTVEGITAIKLEDPEDAARLSEVIANGLIPVIVDPEGISIRSLQPAVVVDARMTKRRVGSMDESIQMMIGLGPGFIAGWNCHAAIETNRGHTLGRVLWTGGPEGDTGVPDRVANYRAERVLRAPVDGRIELKANIGDHLEQGQMVASVEGEPVKTTFKGVLRGVIHPEVRVRAGMKIGDVDPRDDARFCSLISDKSLAIGGGVLEAIFYRQDLRTQLWR